MKENIFHNSSKYIYIKFPFLNLLKILTIFHVNFQITLTKSNDYIILQLHIQIIMKYF